MWKLEDSVFFQYQYYTHNQTGYISLWPLPIGVTLKCFIYVDNEEPWFRGAAISLHKTREDIARKAFMTSSLYN